MCVCCCLPSFLAYTLGFGSSKVRGSGKSLATTRLPLRLRRRDDMDGTKGGSERGEREGEDGEGKDSLAARVASA